MQIPVKTVITYLGIFILGAGALSLFDALMQSDGTGLSRAPRGLLLIACGLPLVWWGWRNARRARALEPAPMYVADKADSDPPISRPEEPQDQPEAQPPLAAVAANGSLTPAPSTPAVAPPLIRSIGGPKIVAIGGGTGMPQLLRGLREYTDSITAIVTVADDGGSSGRLRRQMGMLPPGDFRNNIAALSESEELLTRLFQYRFAHYDATRSGQDKSELAGHSFGNLFIATMAAVSGSFESGLAESSRVLAVRGRVLPSTLEQVHLCAEICRRRTVAEGEVEAACLDDEEWLLVEGESQIPTSGGRIMRVFLKPEAPPAYPEAIRAILQADLIVAGPGSFFTSIMPNLLVPGVRDAICASSAPRIYICNITTQPGETDHFTVSDHMLQLRRHLGEAFTTVLANNHYDLAVPPSPSTQWVTLPNTLSGVEQVSELVGRYRLAYRLFTGNLVDVGKPSHHDARKLAARLMELYAHL